jgi:hypothetical protein
MQQVMQHHVVVTTMTADGLNRKLQLSFGCEEVIASYSQQHRHKMMARARQTCLLGLILLTSVAAFGHTSTAASLLRPLGKSPYKYPRHRLHAEPSPVDELRSNTTPSSAIEVGNLKQALEQFGSLFSQVQAILTEGNTWGSDELEDKTQVFVRTYLAVFIPSLGYAATGLAVFAASFAFFEVVLSISGRGYTDVLAAVSNIGPLRDLLEKADPAWGNAAIALAACELLSPVTTAVTLALTPKTMDTLRTNLDGWGWGEEDINKRVSEMLGK